MHIGISNLKDFLECNPTNGEAWARYGDLLTKFDFEQNSILEAYQNAAKLLPNSCLVQVRLGVAIALYDDFVRGVKICTRALERHPSAPAYCLLADVFLSKEMRSRAKLAAEEAIRLEPNFEEAYFLLAKSILNEELEQAINYLKIAISIDPNYQPAFAELGRWLVGKAVTRKEGISFLEKAIQIDPEDGWSLIYLANAYWAEGRIKCADLMYQSALRCHSDTNAVRKWHNDFLEANPTLQKGKRI